MTPLTSKRGLDVLAFNADKASFAFDGVLIGAAVSSEQLANSFGVAVRHKPDDELWCFIEVTRKTMSVSISFHKGRVHSGSFWVNTHPGGWQDYEQIEAARRAEHERLMNEMFGANRFRGAAISVELVRDPRSGLEQITFQMLGSDV